jgi:hypothetical protein
MAQAAGDVTEFPINSYVLVQYRDRPPTKFHANWEDPMRVIGFKQNTYTIQNLVNMKARDVHVTQLKAFNYDRTETDPVDIARKEAQEFLVESIKQHRGGPLRTQMKFLVHWTGYDDSYDTWEPWNNVKRNAVLLRYLYDNKLKKFLTKEQQAEVRNMLSNTAN